MGTARVKPKVLLVARSSIDAGQVATELNPWRHARHHDGRGSGSPVDGGPRLSVSAPSEVREKLDWGSLTARQSTSGERRTRMILTAEEHEPVPEVTANALDSVLREEGFGTFVVLSASEEDFIQAATAWQPDEASAAFLRMNHSEPWVLEYRSRSSGQFRAAASVTLDQVRTAFASYLSGDQAWRKWHDWTPLD
jgi:hypothetical protein